MSSFKFRFRDLDGDVASDESYEFSDLFAAISEAKRVLGDGSGRTTRSAGRTVGRRGAERRWLSGGAHRPDNKRRLSLLMTSTTS